MAENCINLSDIDHQLSCEGGNMPGIVPEIIFGYHEDVAVWPTEPVPDVDGTTGVVTPVELEAAGALVRKFDDETRNAGLQVQVHRRCR